MKKFTPGFTLIETMIAITILSLSIVGPMLNASRAIVAAQTARDQLTASYLSQEGIEYMRAARDDQFLLAYPSNTANAWTNFLNSSPMTPCRSPGSPGICTLGLSSPGTLTLCSGSGCSQPFTLVTNGTTFTRTIQMLDEGANDERIVSKTSWNFHGTPYAVTITDHLTPWQ